jgi:hypothetical protein
MVVSPPNESKTRVFQLNDEEADFEELELDREVKLYEILNPKSLLYFVDPPNYRSYIWAGSQTSTRMKFIAAQKAPNIRDKLGAAIKISSVDEGDESMPFKVLIGLVSPEEFKIEQTGPTYTGSQTDQAFLEEMSLEKIVLLIEKVGTPEGLKRVMVLDGHNIYGYQMTYKEYMGQIIEERKLYRLQEPVPDGLYLREGLIPRFVMQNNRVIITELFQKMTPEEVTSKAKQ